MLQSKNMKSRTRTSVICVHQDRLLAFKAVDPSSGKDYVFLPGGEIEMDETAPEAAERETMEETGYSVEVVSHLNLDREYVFNWNAEDYQCLTIFYRAYLKNPFQTPRVVDDASYNKGTVWVPLTEINSTFSYHEVIRDAILEMIEDESLSII